MDEPEAEIFGDTQSNKEDAEETEGMETGDGNVSAMTVYGNVNYIIIFFHTSICVMFSDSICVMIL